jgi:hypothetical protein
MTRRSDFRGVILLQEVLGRQQCRLDKIASGPLCGNAITLLRQHPVVRTPHNLHGVVPPADNV